MGTLGSPAKNKSKSLPRNPQEGSLYLQAAILDLVMVARRGDHPIGLPHRYPCCSHVNCLQTHLRMQLKL
jgi:hypothetical protein